MTTVELKEELHSNTRRTRITYRGLVNGQVAAIKCYRKPIFGLIHWVRALRRGKKIRQAGGPVPPIIYSGWVRENGCFGLGMVFLEGYRPLREVLREAPSRGCQIRVLSVLGQTMAELHRRGIEQPDGNLTNFLLGPEGDIQVVDEDDIRVYDSKLPLAVAISNLANVAARLPNEEMVEALLSAYQDEVLTESAHRWDKSRFHDEVTEWRARLESKRSKRNISLRRHFD